MKSTESSLSLDDQVGRSGLHGIAKIRVPSLGRKGFAGLDIGQNSKLSIDLLMARLEFNGSMNNGASSISSNSHDLLGICNRVVLVHGILDRFVQFSSGGRELILELDKDKCCIGGICEAELIITDMRHET